MITKLSHANIYVRDHESAYDFYVNKLGLEVREDITIDNGFRWLTVGSKNQPDLEIVLFVPEAGMMGDEAYNAIRLLLEKGVLGSGVFETDDCQKTYDELVAKGVVFMKPPTQEFYGAEALFSDGCGNWFSLRQH